MSERSNQPTAPSLTVERARPVPIRSVWPNEASDFTPWLAEHLDWLAEDLGLGPLALEATEVPIPGGRSLDLLATDGRGRAVAVENQYAVVNHDHMTRALAYAVAMQASDRPVGALVVIAEEHRSEFVAVADYLNECAAARGEQGIPVFLVEVSVEQITDSPPAVRFTSVARPNEWEDAARHASPGSPTTVEEYLGMLDEADRPVAEGLLTRWEAHPERWVTTGTNSVVLYARNHRVPQARCNVASFFLSASGFWLNPGRLIESGAFDEADLEDLDGRVDSDLPPTTTMGGKGYYLAFPIGEIDPERAMRLLDWITDKLSSGRGDAREGASREATVMGKGGA